jgi:uncharacterized repeat protein (TIGR03803 family)
MKRSFKNLFLLPALIAGFGLISAGRVTPQTFTTLHSFTAGGYVFSGKYTNSDGAKPIAGLILSGNTLYGTVQQGGSSGDGTVFAVKTDGTGFKTVHSLFYGSDGSFPYAGLILRGKTLYGTAQFGGSAEAGTVFRVNTHGEGFTSLYNFTASADPSTYTNSDGGYPIAGLILSGNSLYGTTSYGGGSSRGTVFKVNTHRRSFMTLHTFSAPDIFSFTNSDGAFPYAGLILSGKTLYGTAPRGGSSDNGTVFALNTDGTGFTTLHSFTATFGNYPNYTNNDGAGPIAGVILSGNTLYGTAYGGGSSGNGTVFAVNTDGKGFTNLHNFTALSEIFHGTNSDGSGPLGGLMLSGNALYGTASHGGSSGRGTVFKVKTDGTCFTTLHSFTVISGGYPFEINEDGAYPFAGLILSGNTLYGTASGGGSSGNGTVFSLSLESVSAPQLTVIPSGANVILTWPTNAAGFTLQSSTSHGSRAAWITVSPGPVVVNGLNAVTNPVAGPQKFYRLSQ